MPQEDSPFIRKKETYDIYYLELKTWFKVLKGIFSAISLLIFTMTLFGTKHDVRGFYCSLLLTSSPVFIDLLVIYEIIREKDLLVKKISQKYVVAAYFSFACFVISVSILILGGNNDMSWIVDYLNGSFWWITIILFPVIVYPFYINTIRPIKLVNNAGIEVEARPVA